MARVGTTAAVRGSDRGCVVSVMDEAVGVPLRAPLQGILQSLPQQGQRPYRHTTRD